MRICDRFTSYERCKIVTLKTSDTNKSEIIKYGWRSLEHQYPKSLLKRNRELELKNLTRQVSFEDISFVI